MKFQMIPGVLALSLAAVIPVAAAEKKGAAEAKPAETKPVEAPAAPAAPALDAATIKKTSSYGLGLRTGAEFAQQYGQFGISAEDIDNENFLKGFTAGFKRQKPEISDDEIRNAMKGLGDLLQAREKEAAAKNLEAGEKFLAENGKKEGIVTTKSGLQYQVLAKGGDKKYEAPKEGAADKQFMVNYKGTLIDGTQFDASPEGQPVPMTLEVVEGFKEALTTMPIGAKWKVFMPSKLAYGERRRSPEIGPNTVLIFELELVDIKDAPAAPQGMTMPMQGGAPEGE
jgi:FKBP-type peptidyl-prolyl cis-trans isomerase